MPVAKLSMLFMPVAVCALGGCAAIDPKYPVEVQVISALTGEPVADVPVSIKYVGKTDNWPEDDSGVTDRAGRVALPVADFNRGVTELHVGDRSIVVGKDVVRAGFSTKPTGDSDFERAYRVKLTPKPPSVAGVLGLDVILSSDPTAGSSDEDRDFHGRAGRHLSE